MTTRPEKTEQKRVAGSLKEAIGKVTGDEKLESEGFEAKKSGKDTGAEPKKTGKS